MGLLIIWVMGRAIVAVVLFGGGSIGCKPELVVCSEGQPWTVLCMWWAWVGLV